MSINQAEQKRVSYIKSYIVIAFYDYILDEPSSYTENRGSHTSA